MKLELCEAYAQTLICSNLLGGAKIIPEEEVKKDLFIKISKRGNNSDNNIRK